VTDNVDRSTVERRALVIPMRVIPMRVIPMFWYTFPRFGIHYPALGNRVDRVYVALSGKTIVRSTGKQPFLAFPARILAFTGPNRGYKAPALWLQSSSFVVIT
jgi:hypothetical protein